MSYTPPDAGLIIEAAGDDAQAGAAAEALIHDLKNIELLAQAFVGLCDGLDLEPADLIEAAHEDGPEAVAKQAREVRYELQPDHGDVVQTVHTLAHLMGNRKGPEGDPYYARAYADAVDNVLEYVEQISPRAANSLRTGANEVLDDAGLEPREW